MTPRKGLCYGFINEIDTMEKAGGVPILAGGVCPVPAGEGDRHRRQVYGVVGRAKKGNPHPPEGNRRVGIFCCAPKSPQGASVLFPREGYSQREPVYHGHIPQQAIYQELNHVRTVIALAAAIIGGVTFDGGKGTIGGAFLGCLLMGVISNAMNILGVDTNVQTIITGAIIVGAVVLSNINNIRKK